MCFLEGIENWMGFHLCTNHLTMQSQSKRTERWRLCCVCQK